MSHQVESLVDFFLVCGLPPNIMAMNGEKGFIGNEAKYVPVVLDWLETPEITRGTLPPNIALFCLPCGVDVHDPGREDHSGGEGAGTGGSGNGVPPHQQAPHAHPFITTGEDGSQRYVVSVGFLDLVPAATLRQHPAMHGLQARSCIALVSRFPFLHTFHQILMEIHRCCFAPQGCTRPIPDIVHHLLTVPAPQAGGGSVLFSVEKLMCSVQLPPPTELPLLDFSLQPLVQALDMHHVIQVVQALLTERRVVLQSSYVSLLTLVGEAVRALLFPLTWQHVYIPILPPLLVDYLHAPTPYLVGVQSSVNLQGMFGVKNRTGQQEQDKDFLDLVLVDLDHNTLTTNRSLPDLPQPEGVVLMRRLRSLFAPAVVKLDHTIPYSGAGSLGESPWSSLHDREMRLAFLAFFASLFRSYRSYILPPCGAASLGGIQGGAWQRWQHLSGFHAQAFLRARGGVENETLLKVLESQAFATLVANRAVSDVSEVWSSAADIFDRAVAAVAKGAPVDFPIQRSESGQILTVESAVNESSLASLSPYPHTFKYASFPALSIPQWRPEPTPSPPQPVHLHSSSTQGQDDSIWDELGSPENPVPVDMEEETYMEQRRRAMDSSPSKPSDRGHVYESPSRTEGSKEGTPHSDEQNSTFTFSRVLHKRSSSDNAAVTRPPTDSRHFPHKWSLRLGGTINPIPTTTSSTDTAGKEISALERLSASLARASHRDPPFARTNSHSLDITEKQASPTAQTSTPSETRTGLSSMIPHILSSPSVESRDVSPKDDGKRERRTSPSADSRIGSVGSIPSELIDQTPSVSIGMTESDSDEGEERVKMTSRERSDPVLAPRLGDVFASKSHSFVSCRSAGHDIVSNETRHAGEHPRKLSGASIPSATSVTIKKSALWTLWSYCIPRDKHERSPMTEEELHSIKEILCDSPASSDWSFPCELLQLVTASLSGTMPFWEQHEAKNTSTSSKIWKRIEESGENENVFGSGAVSRGIQDQSINMLMDLLRGEVTAAAACGNHKGVASGLVVEASLHKTGWLDGYSSGIGDSADINDRNSANGPQPSTSKPSIVSTQPTKHAPFPSENGSLQNLGSDLRQGNVYPYHGRHANLQRIPQWADRVQWDAVFQIFQRQYSIVFPDEGESGLDSGVGVLLSGIAVSDGNSSNAKSIQLQFMAVLASYMTRVGYGGDAAWKVMEGLCGFVDDKTSAEESTSPPRRVPVNLSPESRLALCGRIAHIDMVEKCRRRFSSGNNAPRQRVSTNRLDTRWNEEDTSAGLGHDTYRGKWSNVLSVQAHGAGVSAMDAHAGIVISAAADSSLVLWRPDPNSDSQGTVHRLVKTALNSSSLQQGSSRALYKSNHQSDNNLNGQDASPGENVDDRLRGNVAAMATSVKLQPGPHTRALVGNSNGTVDIWDVTAAKHITCIPGHTGRVGCLTLGGSKWEFVSGSFDGTARIWDLRTKNGGSTCSGQAGAITCLLNGLDGQTLMTGSADHTCCLWDLRKTRAPLLTLAGHSDWVSTMRHGPGGVILSASRDWTVRVWDVTTGTCQGVLIGHTADVTSVCVTTVGGSKEAPEGVGKVVMTGSLDGTVRLWSLDEEDVPGDDASLATRTTWNCIRVVKAYAPSLCRGQTQGMGVGGILALNVFERGHTDATGSDNMEERIISYDYDNAMAVWSPPRSFEHAQHWQPCRKLQSHPAVTRKIAFDQKHLAAVSGLRDGRLMHWS